MIKLRPRRAAILWGGACHEFMNSAAKIVSGRPEAAYLGPVQGWRLSYGEKWTAGIERGVVEIEYAPFAASESETVYETAMGNVLAYRLDAELVECPGTVELPLAPRPDDLIWAPVMKNTDKMTREELRAALIMAATLHRQDLQEHDRQPDMLA